MFVHAVGGETRSGKKRKGVQSVAQASTQQGTTDACAYNNYNLMITSPLLGYIATIKSITGRIQNSYIYYCVYVLRWWCQVANI